MEKRNTLFISVLGTNDYLPCCYFFYPREEQRVEGVRFVQEAILRLLAQQEDSKPDEVIIFATQGASEANWRDDGHKDSDGKPLNRKGFASSLEDAGYKPRRKEIPDGKSEGEIWQIFQIIIDSIPEKSRLVVDITHSFRSLSMILLAAIQYLKAVKAVEMDAIHYGAMEVLGPVSKVRNMEPTDRMVPIFDLTPFDAIMDWSRAAASFVESGNPAGLRGLANKKIIPILRQTRGQDEEAKSLRRFVDSLDEFCSNLMANRGPLIADSAAKVHENLAQTQGISLLPPMVPLLNIIDQELKGFQGDSLDVAIQTARWCLEHNFIPQAYTFLQEGIITWVLERVGESTVDDPEKRQAASSAFVIRAQNMKKNKWNSNALKHEKLIHDIHTISGFDKLSSIMDPLAQRRNNINHSGYNKDKLMPKKLKSELEKALSRLESWKTTHGQ